MTSSPRSSAEFDRLSTRYEELLASLEDDGKRQTDATNTVGNDGDNVERDCARDFSDSKFQRIYSNNDDAEQLTNNFLDSKSQRLHFNKEMAIPRLGISYFKPKLLIGIGAGLTAVGAVAVLAGAALTGATMGGAAPVGALLIGFGLGLTTTGMGTVALGVTKIVRRHNFDSKVEKFEKNVGEKLTDNVKKKFENDVANLKTYYKDRTLRDSKMKLLELQIKYDKDLKPEQKLRLLKDYANEEINKKDFNALKWAYEGEKLKGEIRDHFGKDDVTTANNLLYKYVGNMTKKDVLDLKKAFKDSKKKT